MKQPTRFTAIAGKGENTNICGKVQNFQSFADEFKKDYFSSKYNLQSMMVQPEKPQIIQKKEPTRIVEDKQAEDNVDPDEVDQRFNKYFDGLKQRGQDKPMPQKSGNLDGLDLELSQTSRGFELMMN